MNQINEAISSVRGTDLEPFNGCNEMVSVREIVDGRTTRGPAQAILTARVTTDAVLTRTIRISLLAPEYFCARQPAELAPDCSVLNTP